MFDSDVQGGRDLFVSVGAGPSTALTSTADIETIPTPSPARDKIAYVREGSSTMDIFVMTSSGAAGYNASNSSEADVGVAWSPDGQWLAISRDNGTIAVVRSDGMGGAVLPLGLPGGASSDPSWSPDSQKIVFASNTSDEGGIFSINLDGTSKTEIKRFDNSRVAKPQWSPDGSLIAYSAAFGNHSDIHVTDPAGTSSLPSITSTANADEIDLVWSHDGSMIAFVREQDGRRDIWRVNADGTQPISLTFDAAQNEFPRWSLDDTYITFDTNRDGQWEVYRVSRDGGVPTNISMSSAEDRHGDWLPCPP